MRPESTLLELLEEAADTYGMPLGTGEKLRSAAARLRSEMERGRNSELKLETVRILERINGGGPLGTEGSEER